MLSVVADLLERKIGLSVECIGEDAIRSAVTRHMRGRKISEQARYIESLRSQEFIEELIELAVVPETWFFRDRKSFEFLGGYVRSQGLAAKRSGNLRLLSMPCSTGEEPYTIVMALLDAGFPLERIQVDAIDVSAKALEIAKEGLYGWSSFRGNDLSFQQRYFRPSGDYFRILESVRGRVRFLKGNVVGREDVCVFGQYDIIFCRNLVIYLAQWARRKIMDVIDRLLAPEGLLFIGHTETMAFEGCGFRKDVSPGVFVCRRAQDRETSRVQGTSERIGKSGDTALALKTVRVAPPQINHSPPPAPGPSLESAQTPYQCALGLADQGNLVEASRVCLDALGKDPMHLGANFLMGLILMEMRHEEEAVKYFEKVIYLNPGHDQALDYVALIEANRSNLMRANLLRQWARRIREK
jgi:chemotaxis protein methyltransferase WspC